MQFNYTSEALDTTGLIYLCARYIQPTLDTFLARDPWSGEVLRPVSVNVFHHKRGRRPNAPDLLLGGVEVWHL